MTTAAGTVASRGAARSGRPQNRRLDSGTNAAAHPRASRPTSRPPRYEPSGSKRAVTTVAEPAGITQPCFQPSRRIDTSAVPWPSRAVQPELKFCATVRTDSCGRGPTANRRVLGSGRDRDTATDGAGLESAWPGVVKETCRGSNSAFAVATTLCGPAASAPGGALACVLGL